MHASPAIGLFVSNIGHAVLTVPSGKLAPLARWRDELRRGARTIHQCDDLLRAACRHASAEEFDRMGLRSIGDELRREASAILGHTAEPTASDAWSNVADVALKSHGGPRAKVDPFRGLIR